MSTAWEDVEIVCVEGLFRDLLEDGEASAGCAVQSVYARDRTTARESVLAGYDEREPILDVPTYEMYPVLVKKRLWYKLANSLQARRGYRAFVWSVAFQEAMAKCGGEMLSDGEQLDRDLWWVYKDKHEIAAFYMDARMTMLLGAVKQAKNGQFDEATAILDQVRYICDRHTDARTVLYAIYRHVVDPSTWAAMVEDVWFETAMTDAQLAIREAEFFAGGH